MTMRRKLDLSDESGATALEFALVSPVLITLLVGLFQVAWAMHCAATVRWSLETASRKLLMNPAETATTLKSDMVGLLGGSANSNNLTVSITPDTSNPAGKMLVAASVYTTNLVIPLLPSTALTFNASTSVPAI
jgi:Flp pilus assembly protein TadG